MKKKKLFSLLGTVIVPTLLLGSFLGGALNSKSSIKASADSVVDKYIKFNADNFTVANNPVGFDDANNWVTGRHGTFWTHRYFNALDDFYDGFRNEGWTGTITSRTWTQTENYVTFTLGGNPFDGENVANRVVIKSGETEIASVHNEAFNDPSLSLNMIVKVVEIPTEYLEDELHLEIIDGKTGGFGAITFGALKVNQTSTEVNRTIKTHKVNLASIDTDSENNAHKNSVARAVTLAAYDNVFYNTFTNVALTNVNEDFEVNQMTNWGYDIDYSQVSVEDTGKFLAVNFNNAVSSDTTFWGEEIPFNKQGTSFYNGWSAVAAESAKYRYLSAPMTISGSGIMSVKMGGRTAELQILNPTTLATLATFRNPSFVDAGASKIVSTNSRLATMTRVVVDASDYIDDEVIIALADAENGGGWGLAFFDELVTYYATAPTFQLDLLSHQGENGVIKDMFIGADGSEIKEAYTFLQSYYATLRDDDEDFTYCGLLGSNAPAVNGVVGQYDLLSAGAKTIVDGSQDYSYALLTPLLNPVELTDVGTSMLYIKANVSSGGSGVRNVSTSVTSESVILIALISLTALVGFAIYTKKTKKD